MSLNLRLLNLFLGMCKGAEGLPRGLYELGFKAEAVEFKFNNSENKAVVPELIIASEPIHHTVLFEWKSGANTEADQLHRYSKVTTDDLIARAYLAPGKCTIHDVAVVGRDEHRGTIPIGITDGGYDFPVLVTTPVGIETILNQFKVQQTDAIFRPLAVNWDALPTAFFPLDAESELWEFAEQAIPHVLQEMQKGSPRVLANEIGKHIVPLWETMRADYRGLLETKIKNVLDRATRKEFNKNLRKNKKLKAKTGTPTWDILENPLVEAADKRHKAWKAMLRQQKALIEYFKDPNRQEDLELNEA